MPPDEPRKRLPGGCNAVGKRPKGNEYKAKLKQKAELEKMNSKLIQI